MLSLVSINWALDSLGDQAASLSLLLFQPSIPMRQKTHQASWELSVVRQPVGKASIKYSFYKITLCTPSWGKILFFSWNICMVRSACKEGSLKIADRSFCVSTSIFYHLTHCFKKTFLYTCVSLNLSPVTKSSVGVISSRGETTV